MEAARRIWNRQRANEAFNKYLVTLWFPDDDLNALFTCTKCERTWPDGTKQMDGIVMDGTAAGILEELPKFVRVQRSIPSISSVAEVQYLMPTPMLRAFIDAIFRAAPSARDETTFAVRLKPYLWEKVNELRDRFFKASYTDTAESDAAGVFLDACFELMTTTSNDESIFIPQDRHDVDGFTEDDESMNHEVDTTRISNALRMRSKMDDINVRRTCIDFGRCFIVGSIAGGSLRRNSAVAKVKELCTVLNIFSSCKHVQAPWMQDHVCEICSMNFLEMSASHDEYIPSAARLSRAIAKASILGSSSNLRRLALSCSSVLKKSINARSEFFQLFNDNACPAVHGYNFHHQFGAGMTDVSLLNWLKEASRTGELFPGRPEVRPRVDFGRSSRFENKQTCRKNYKASSTFSPGLFTVQCVCSNPNLLGLSVMLECEGISTALSALLSRFKALPRVCYYDNAYNMAKSVVLRFPWVSDECIIVCDRFHYKGHICNSVWDPDSYASCRAQASSGAESINRLWSMSKTHLRFLDPQNLMPFLAIRAAFINVRSMIRQKNRTSDIKESAFRKFVQSQWTCSCSRCIQLDS